MVSIKIILTIKLKTKIDSLFLIVKKQKFINIISIFITDAGLYLELKFQIYEIFFYNRFSINYLKKYEF